MFSCLLILFPLFVSGQSEITPEDVPSQQCRDEFAKINGCIRDTRIFFIIDDIPSNLDPSKSKALIDEINHVIECSGSPTCDDNNLFLNYFYQQTAILKYYQEHLEKCWGNGTSNNVQRICDEKEDVGIQHVYIDGNPCPDRFYPCFFEELKKQPTCTARDILVSEYFADELKESCIQTHKIAEVWKKYEV